MIFVVRGLFGFDLLGVFVVSVVSFVSSSLCFYCFFVVFLLFFVVIFFYVFRELEPLRLEFSFAST